MEFVAPCFPAKYGKKNIIEFLTTIFLGMGVVYMFPKLSSIIKTAKEPSF